MDHHCGVPALPSSFQAWEKQFEKFVTIDLISQFGRAVWDLLKWWNPFFSANPLLLHTRMRKAVWDHLAWWIIFWSASLPLATGYKTGSLGPFRAIGLIFGYQPSPITNRHKKSGLGLLRVMDSTLERLRSTLTLIVEWSCDPRDDVNVHCERRRWR